MVYEGVFLKSAIKGEGCLTSAIQEGYSTSARQRGVFEHNNSVEHKWYTRCQPEVLSGLGQRIQSKFAEPVNYMGALAMRQCVLIDAMCEVSQSSKYKT
jgi:hypothetical protein